MKLKGLLCLAVFCFSLMCAYSQDLKIIVDKKGKVGFSDPNGNEVIKCEYESAQPFVNGIAIVTKSGKSGIIDASGNILLPLIYTHISTWNKDLYLIKNGKKMGLADHQGKVVLPVNYSHISKANCYGKALIALGGKPSSYDKKTYMANAKYGIIDTKGNILVNPQYKGLYEFSYDCSNIYPYYEGKRLEYSYHYTVDTLVTDCSYLGFSKYGFSIYNSGIIDGNGKELVKTGPYTYVMYPQNGMVRYYITKKKETLCGYYNIDTGTEILVAKFDSKMENINFWTHGDFIGNIAPVNGASWSFIDKNGTSLRSDFSSVKHSITTGLWAGKNSSDEWDVFDDANNNVETLSGYGEIRFPSKEGDMEIFSVMKDGKFGCVKRMGEVVVPFEYEQALSNSYDFIAVQKDGKWGLLKADNTKVIPIEYMNIILPSERDANHFWVQKEDSLYYHMNLLAKKFSSVGYKVVYNFDKDFAYVVPQDMKVEDTPINRAQVYAPYTSKATLDDIDMSKHTNAFVYIINTKDELVFDLPVSTLYMDIVREELEKCGGQKLSKTEKKNLLLKATQENRSYDLKSTLSEEEWNY